VTQRVPGPGRLRFLFELPEVRRNPLAYLCRSVAEYGDIFRIGFGPVTIFVVNDPEAVNRVLVEKSTEYVKGRSARALSRILGQGLITSGGELWRRQRTMIQPAFQRDFLSGLIGTMTTSVDSMLSGWPAKQGDIGIDMHEEFSRLAIRIVGKTLFGVDIGDQSSQLTRAFAEANAHADYYVKRVFMLPAWAPTPRGLAVQRTKRTLRSLVQHIIDEHRKAERSDLLSLMIEVPDETGQRMSDSQIHDEVLTMVAAGHETVANTLTWCFYLLGAHPEIQRKLHTEVAAVLADRTPTLADLPKLAYTSSVVQEAMRLYPPIWSIEREATVDDDLLGHRIPAGSSLALFTYGVHRHERYWEQPEEFRPERFSPEQSERRPRSIYLPFGAGPRRCIGNNFAMMEAEITLAMVVQRFWLFPVPNHPVEPEPLISLRPRYGLRMTVEARRGVTTRNTGSAQV